MQKVFNLFRQTVMTTKLKKTIVLNAILLYWLILKLYISLTIEIFFVKVQHEMDINFQIC